MNRVLVLLLGFGTLAYLLLDSIEAQIEQARARRRRQQQRLALERELMALVHGRRFRGRRR